MIEPFRQKTITRLKKAKGQLDGILKMIETDVYCPKILTQVLALQGSIKGVNALIMENHLNTCGRERLASKDPDVREEFIQELMKVCDLSSR